MMAASQYSLINKSDKFKFIGNRKFQFHSEIESTRLFEFSITLIHKENDVNDEKEKENNNYFNSNYF